jgi:N-methylhydantoinase A
MRSLHEEASRELSLGQLADDTALSLGQLADDTALSPAGGDRGGASFDEELFVQMAYAGQNSDVSVPVPEGTALDESGLLDLAERFHDLHESDRGFAFRNQQPVIRGVRLVGTKQTPKPSHVAELGTVVDASHTSLGARQVHFDDGWVDTTVLDGSVLGAGARAEGPALVQEAFTVVAVPPGWQVELGTHGSYELTRVS